MASKSFFCVTLFMSMLVSLTLAQQPLFFPPPLPQVPGASIQQCAAAIYNIGGCYAEIVRAYGAGSRAIFTIGPVCCKAAHDLSAKCWSQMFPYDPFFPPVVKNYCARYNTGPYAVVAPAPAVM